VVVEVGRAGSMAKTRSSEFESRDDGKIGKGISGAGRGCGRCWENIARSIASEIPRFAGKILPPDGGSTELPERERNRRKEVSPPSHAGSVKRERAPPLTLPSSPKLRKTLFSSDGKGEFRDPPEQKSRSLLAPGTSASINPRSTVYTGANCRW